MNHVDPEILALMQKRGGLWAAYENKALDSFNCGHLQFLKYGLDCTYATPPKSYPADTTHGLGWRYQYIGVIDLISGEIHRISSEDNPPPLPSVSSGASIEEIKPDYYCPLCTAPTTTAVCAGCMDELVGLEVRLPGPWVPLSPGERERLQRAIGEDMKRRVESEPSLVIATVRLTKREKDEMKALALHKGTTFSDMVRVLIQEEIKRSLTAIGE